MSIFNETELAKALESLYNDPNALAGQFKMPFKYKTLTYVKKILACQEDISYNSNDEIEKELISILFLFSSKNSNDLA